MKKVTIKDIARIAGVSRGTVDRVINRRGNVSSKLEEKVIKIANELGYEKNLMASSLASNKTYKVAVVCPDPNLDSFWSLPRNGILDALELVKHYGVQASFFDFDIFDKQSFSIQLENAINSRPEAILVAPVYNSEALEAIILSEALNIPFITINTEIKHQNILCYAGQNSFQSGYLAGRLLHLRLKPKEEVIVINLGHNFSNAQHYSDKLEGIRQYFKDNQMEDNPIIWYEFEAFKQPEKLKKFWKDIQKKHPNLKGLFFTNSRAYHLVHLIKPSDLEKLEIVGFDMLQSNINLLKDGKISFIINQNAKQQGYASILNFVNHFILKKSVPKTQYLPLDIVVRENVDFYAGVQVDRLLVKTH